MTEVKTGKQFLNSFFSELKTINNLDSEVIALLVKLFEENKLTNTNIENGLSQIREKWDHENKINKT